MYVKQLNKPANDFAMIPRAVTRMGLSAEAIGLLVIVACEPGDVITASRMSQKMGCGKDKRQRVLRELAEKGLLRIERSKTERGTFTTGYVFDWDAVSGRKVAENPPEPENPALVDHEPEPENPAPGRKTRPTGPENPAIYLERAPERVAPQGQARSGAETRVIETLQQAPDLAVDQLWRRAKVAAECGQSWKHPETGRWFEAWEFAEKGVHHGQA